VKYFLKCLNILIDITSEIEMFILVNFRTHTYDFLCCCLACYKFGVMLVLLSFFASCLCSFIVALDHRFPLRPFACLLE